MAQDKAATNRKLNELWNDTSIHEAETANEKYIIFSDIHLGNGGAADDFRENRQAMVSALNHYRRNGFTLILLGDIEELWQFDLEDIIEEYQNTVYKAIRSFGDNRIIRVFGNHDIEWGFMMDPAKNTLVNLGTAVEAVKLRDSSGNARILLVHGHQGSTESDKNSWISRFFVRMFKLVEPISRSIGLYGEGSSTKSQIPANYERILYSWAKRKRAVLICGHSHRAIFASKSWYDRLGEEIARLQVENLTLEDAAQLQENAEQIGRLLQQKLREENKGRSIDPADPEGKPKPCYFNTGCALYTDGITGMEIESDTMRLVKWHAETGRRPSRKVYQKDSLSTMLALL